VRHTDLTPSYEVIFYTYDLLTDQMGEEVGAQSTASKRAALRIANTPEHLEHAVLVNRVVPDGNPKLVLGLTPRERLERRLAGSAPASRHRLRDLAVTLTLLPPAEEDSTLEVLRQRARHALGLTHTLPWTRKVA
jgi:hypothetical protein